MQKLSRGEPPLCLIKFQHGKHSWNRDVKHDDKEIIWERLYEMQGRLCAYCESALIDNKKHIEHFIPKGRHEGRTLEFSWSNLFGSCLYTDRCGHYKDSVKDYVIGNLIKPDNEDPDDYLIFFSDGTIKPREGLHPVQTLKASETLRVFKLDEKNGALRHQRQQAIKAHIQTVEFLVQLLTECPNSASEIKIMIETEIQRAATEPYVTAVRHFYRNNLEL
jgi:uncharacterized protein (TIGR02646 family)